MFFDGFTTKGRCVSNGHVAQGFTFVLPFDEPETPTAQANWRFCNKCFSMFFGPIPGRCIAGGGHDSSGSVNFVLPHDIPETPEAQQGWRFCRKCSRMFFSGNAGVCVAGGGHDGTGSFNFVLPHKANFIEPPIFDVITLSSGGLFLNGRTAGDHGVDLLTDGNDPNRGTRWRRGVSGNRWTLECLGNPPPGTDPGRLFLAGTSSNTVLIAPDQQHKWKATPVGNGFTLENRTQGLQGKFLVGPPGRDAFLADGGNVVWTVGFPPTLFDDPVLIPVDE
jgi:hypothetical protein